MGARADYVAALAAQLAGGGETPAAILDRPVSPVPGTPCVIVTPGSPYLEASGPLTYRLRLDVVLFAARLDTQSAMETLDAYLPHIRIAAPLAELRWLLCTVGVENVAGVDYVTARNALEGETKDP